MAKKSQTSGKAAEKPAKKPGVKKPKTPDPKTYDGGTGAAAPPPAPPGGDGPQEPQQTDSTRAVPIPPPLFWAVVIIALILTLFLLAPVRSVLTGWVSREHLNNNVPSGILMVNCMEDAKKGLKSPRVSIEDGTWYYVHLQLIALSKKDDAVLGKLAPKFAEAGKGTKKLDDYLNKIAAVQHNVVVPHSYEIYTLMAGPFTYAEYKSFVSEMWTILVKLRYGRVDAKEKDGKAVLTTNYHDGIFSVQLFSPKWDTKPLEKRQNEFSREVEKGFNKIMQNEADDSLAEIRRLNEELQR